MDPMIMYYLTWMAIPAIFVSAFVAVKMNNNKVKIKQIEKEKAEIELEKEKLLVSKLIEENRKLDNEINALSN